MSHEVEVHEHVGAVKVFKSLSIYHHTCVHCLNELAGVTSPCMGFQLT